MKLTPEELLDEIKMQPGFNSLHTISKQHLEYPAMIWWYNQIVKCYYIDSARAMQVLKDKCEGNFKSIIYDAMVKIHKSENQLTLFELRK